MQPRKDIFGYFDRDADETPFHDPGTDTICPYCGNKLSSERVTISMVREGHYKSYFYRADKSCYENAGEQTISEIEGSLIDMLPVNL